MLCKIRSAIKCSLSLCFAVVCDNVLISRFLSGLFSLTLPKTTWDINVVLDFINTLPPNEDLPLVLLSQKLVVLLLLSTMRRRSEILGFHLDYFWYRPNEVIFGNVFKPKNWSYFCTPYHGRYVHVRRFHENNLLCPVLCFQHYVHRTKFIRKSRFLLITTQGKFDQAAPMTVRRWVLQLLFRAGIDVTRFTPSTTRHAASSNAYMAGISLSDILCRAGWVEPSVLICHYNLPVILSEVSDFGESTECSARVFCDHFHFRSVHPPSFNRSVSRACTLLSKAKAVIAPDRTSQGFPSFATVPHVRRCVTVKTSRKFRLPAKRSAKVKVPLVSMYTRSVLQSDIVETDPASE